MLGARTPAESLALAVAETDAIAVVLVSHLAAGRPAAIETLRSPELSQRHVFYAGGAFGSPRTRRGVPGQYLGTNIAAGRGPDHRHPHLGVARSRPAERFGRAASR